MEEGADPDLVSRLRHCAKSQGKTLASRMSRTWGRGGSPDATTCSGLFWGIQGSKGGFGRVFGVPSPPSPFSPLPQHLRKPRKSSDLLPSSSLRPRDSARRTCPEKKRGKSQRQEPMLASTAFLLVASAGLHMLHMLHMLHHVTHSTHSAHVAHVAHFSDFTPLAGRHRSCRCMVEGCCLS